MHDDLQLNVQLLRRRVPNLTVAARNVGLRSATVSDLCNGKIPLGRAEVRTLVALADLADCTLDELVIRGAEAQIIETGLKVLDLFAPLVRGGSVGLVARQGMGQVVLLQELIRRLRQRGFATVVWLPADGRNDAASEAEAVGTTADEVYRHVSALRADRDVLLATDRSVVLSGELDALRERLQEPGARPVTFALVDTLGDSPDEDLPYGPLETLWRFDVDLAARGLFPAVHSVASASTLLEGAHVDSAHLTVQQRARKLMRRYYELHALARARGAERIPAAELQTYRRGERLEAFLTQPLYVAEPFTKQAGQWVSVQATVEGVRRILDGAADEMAAESLRFVGPFQPAPAGREP
ncbi:MAG TPA: hypothetical protein VNT01_12370 [Symbiobacteriaceae bacterium]|nr:hypothetical protein [Symbiobacteriaceae bacterium]